jgi:hypothetical protein
LERPPPPPPPPTSRSPQPTSDLLSEQAVRDHGEGGTSAAGGEVRVDAAHTEAQEAATEAQEAATEAQEAATEALSREEARVALTGFYREFNPEKLGDVEYILDKYQGDYTSLFTRLRMKYASGSPPPVHPRAAASGGDGDGGGGGGGEAKQPSKKLAAGFSSLFGGLNDKMKDAGEKVRDAVEKGREKVRESGKLEEFGSALEELKLKGQKLRDNLKGKGKLPSGWSWAKDSEGVIYFFHRGTGAVTYRDPRIDAMSAEGPTAGGLSDLGSAAPSGSGSDDEHGILGGDPPADFVVTGVAATEQKGTPSPPPADSPEEAAGVPSFEGLVGLAMPPVPAQNASTVGSALMEAAARSDQPRKVAKEAGASDVLIDFE